MIKITASVLLAIIYFVASDPMSDMENGMKKCGPMYNITDPSSIMQDRSMILRDISNENGRCFIECLMLFFKIYDGTSVTQTAVTAQIQDMAQFAKTKGVDVDQNALSAAVAKCYNIDGDGKCMKSYKMWVCMDSAVQKVMGPRP